MKYTVEGFSLDQDNRDFFRAFELVENTHQHIFLTGKAGTGKTTFLKYVKENCTKKLVVTSFTGIAAVNAGGVTLNSFFQIRPGIFVPGDLRLRYSAGNESEDKSTIWDHFQYREEKREIIRELELLIIDEVSMVRCDLMDVIDRLLRAHRKKRDLPFGGVQVLLIGDVFQLPPVTKNDQWRILEPFYTSSFFFSSMVIKSLIKSNQLVSFELRKIYRQNDPLFIGLLNKIRVNKVSPEDINKINSRYDPYFRSNGKDGYVVLATHNEVVDRINDERISLLKSKTIRFEALIWKDFPEYNYPTSECLILKEGAQVMFVKNDWGQERKYFNGSIGTVTKIEKEKVFVTLKDNNELIEVNRHVWKNIRYTWDNKEKKIREEVLGTFNQLPLRLAWAITVNKSQGMTFTRVIADLEKAWASGQVYVGLSRCVSMEGLVLKSKITSSCIKVHPYAVKFMNYVMQ